MIDGLKVVAVVPARGGSKGIPGKNLYKIDGKPLLQYTLDEAVRSRYLDTILISTDDRDIAEFAVSHGAAFNGFRPAELAGDNARTIDAVLWELDRCPGFDIMVILQPTQPLRKHYQIDSALEAHRRTGLSVVGVSTVREHPELFRILQDERLVPFLNMPISQRRQDFRKLYRVNGTIYVNAIRDLESETILNNNSYPIIIDYPHDLDIDDARDIEDMRFRLGLGQQL